MEEATRKPIVLICKALILLLLNGFIVITVQTEGLGNYYEVCGCKFNMLFPCSYTVREDLFFEFFSLTPCFHFLHGFSTASE